jgi:hypothetical protein
MEVRLQVDPAGDFTDKAVMKADIAPIKAEKRVHTRTLNISVQDGRLLRAAVNERNP